MPAYFDKKVEELKGRPGVGNPYALARFIETRHMAKVARETGEWRPSLEASHNAALGLSYVKAGFGGRGLVPSTLAWARKLAARKPIPFDRLKTMAAWFARHAVDRRRGWSNPLSPSPGYVAFLLWGGLDAARYVTRAMLGHAYKP